MSPCTAKSTVSVCKTIFRSCNSLKRSVCDAEISHKKQTDIVRISANFKSYFLISGRL